MRKTVEILGTKVDTFTAPQALDYIVQLAEDGKGHYIVTPNPEFVMQSLNDTEFREIINRADLSLPDGVGILWAAKYLALPISRYRWWACLQAYGQLISTGIEIVLRPKSLLAVIPERVTGADMIWEMSKLAAEHSWSIFLVGGAPGVARETADRLKLIYPQLKIAGVVTGPPYESESEVINQIKTNQPKFVFLAFTAKEQLRWMREYAAQLPGIMMGVGGAFDFIAGTVAINAPMGSLRPAHRAPRWLQIRGLEWLWRYCTQPWRRARIKIATVGFISQVLRDKLSRIMLL